MDDLLAKLNLYSALGWPVHPCHSSHPDPKKLKAPQLAGWQQEATTDPSRIRQWAEQKAGCAWGLAASDAVGVLDVDPRNGGDISLAALVAEHGPLPETPTVSTGGGGHHYYFRFPDGFGSHPAFKPGLDVKASGGNVILPPSVIHCPRARGQGVSVDHKPAGCWHRHCSGLAGGLGSGFCCWPRPTATSPSAPSR